MAAIEPMKQFLIERVAGVPPIVINGMDFSITNSVLMMLIAAVLIVVLFSISAKGAIVPGRMQAVGESLYDLIDGTLVTPIIGHNGKPYIPFVFTIFMLVLTMNMMGVVLAVGHVGGQDWTFTPTAQLAVTATLAVITFMSVVIIGFIKNGLGFFKLFVPPGVHWAMALFIGFFEFISFIVRPLTLAMRLFGNMLGGHVVMNIFASFVVALGAVGLAGFGLNSLGLVGSGLSLAMVIALTGLELVVAGLQAFVFAALATVYLNEVVNLGHGH
ncbi:F0F1 ATP synthase subunit A [Caulobacter sp. KR2-114]|uniref:F0F1 ATP synthase subunit A n=1 Tax=Caulobacter sp. KR2-114 TaxID=3400912 RepID=UPI003C046A00